MPELPTTTGNAQIKTNIYNWYGINRTRRGSKGEFEDMYNMSTLEYPCAAPRGKRYYLPFDATGTIQAVAAPDRTNVDEITGLTGIMDDIFYYNGEQKGDLTDYAGCTYQIIRLANLYVINCYYSDDTSTKANVFYYNIDTDTWDTAVAFMSNLILHAEDSMIETYHYATSNTSSTSYYKYVYYYECEDEEGNTLRNRDFFDNYKYYSSANIFETFGFEVGDEILIEGFPTEDENFGQVWYVNASADDPIITQSDSWEENNVIDLDTVPDVSALGDDVIVKAVITDFSVNPHSLNGQVVGYNHRMYLSMENKNGDAIEFSDMYTTRSSKNGYKIWCTGVKVYSQSLKKFTNIAAHNDALWGTSPNGDYIYSTTSGGTFSVTEADIAAQVADKKYITTPGYFTGLCEYGSELIAFKDESITIVYGSNIGEYGISNIMGTGCIDGRSIISTQSGVFFLGYNGFYLFNGNNSSLISSRLNTKYTECIAGYDGQIYYASAKRADTGAWELLTYDTRYSTWHVQDDFEAVGFFTFRGKFYMADSDSVYETDSAEDCEDVEWSFTAYRTHDNTLNEKSLNEIWIRAEVEDGAEFTVYTDMDNLGFEKHSTFKKPGLNIYICPVRTLSGSYYRYRITGKGNVVFYEIELHKSKGGNKFKELPGTVTRDPLHLKPESFDGDY